MWKWKRDWLHSVYKAQGRDKPQDKHQNWRQILGQKDGVRSFVQHRLLTCHLLMLGVTSRVRPRGCSWVCEAAIQAQDISCASAGTSTALAGLVGLHAGRHLRTWTTGCSSVPTWCLLFSRTSQISSASSWDVPPSCHSGLTPEQMCGKRMNNLGHLETAVSILNQSYAIIGNVMVQMQFNASCDRLVNRQYLYTGLLETVLFWNPHKKEISDSQWKLSTFKPSEIFYILLDYSI